MHTESLAFLCAPRLMVLGHVVHCADILIQADVMLSCYVCKGFELVTFVAFSAEYVAGKDEIKVEPPMSLHQRVQLRDCVMIERNSPISFRFSSRTVGEG
eukprot:TRINITY_DN4476_c0_g2_i1.p1 TRINITY_DN4476_c0_g2~~TRINITY_DN4476_c0_g2_i1.p1  ORF type:complete len:100 (-),score=3.91 TRINITY_DN4476_c0_g2_i1:1001-1300(-)